MLNHGTRSRATVKALNFASLELTALAGASLPCLDVTDPLTVDLALATPHTLRLCVGVGGAAVRYANDLGSSEAIFERLVGQIELLPKPINDVRKPRLAFIIELLSLADEKGVPADIL